MHDNAILGEEDCDGVERMKEELEHGDVFLSTFRDSSLLPSHKSEDSRGLQSFKPLYLTFADAMSMGCFLLFTNPLHSFNQSSQLTKYAVVFFSPVMD